jgi:hypothetical protein
VIPLSTDGTRENNSTDTNNNILQFGTQKCTFHSTSSIPPNDRIYPEKVKQLVKTV